MAKKMKSFRLDQEVLDMMQTLVVYLSSEKSIKLNETMLLELLVTEKYKELVERD